MQRILQLSAPSLSELRKFSFVRDRLKQTTSRQLQQV